MKKGVMPVPVVVVAAVVVLAAVWQAGLVPPQNGIKKFFCPGGP